jgi:hypothetical protein
MWRDTEFTDSTLNAPAQSYYQPVPPEGQANPLGVSQQASKAVNQYGSPDYSSQGQQSWNSIQRFQASIVGPNEMGGGGYDWNASGGGLGVPQGNWNEDSSMLHDVAPAETPEKKRVRNQRRDYETREREYKKNLEKLNESRKLNEALVASNDNYREQIDVILEREASLQGKFDSAQEHLRAQDMHILELENLWHDAGVRPPQRNFQLFSS